MARLPNLLRMSSTASSRRIRRSRFWWSTNIESCSASFCDTKSIPRIVIARIGLSHRYRSIRRWKPAPAISLGSCVLNGSLHWYCEPYRSFVRMETWTPHAINSWTRSRCPTSWLNSSITRNTSSGVCRSAVQVIPCPMDLTGLTKSLCITREVSVPFAYIQSLRPLIPSICRSVSGEVFAKSPMVRIPYWASLFSVALPT